MPITFDLTREISSVAQAKAASTSGKWRPRRPEDIPLEEPTGAECEFAIEQYDSGTGENTIVLAIGKGARSYLHQHNPGKPYRERIECLKGSLHGADPHRPDFILEEGASIELNDDVPHAPYVLPDGFALVRYHQPGGHTRV